MGAKNKRPKCPFCESKVDRGTLLEHIRSVHPLTSERARNIAAGIARLHVFTDTKSAFVAKTERPTGSGGTIRSGVEKPLPFKIALRVEGVIERFSKPYGVVFLKRRSVSSLQEMIDICEKSKGGTGFWRARFHWSSIDERSKESIGKPLAALGGKSLVGLQVVCDVVKTDKWRVESMCVDCGKPKLKLNFSSSNRQQVSGKTSDAGKIRGRVWSATPSSVLGGSHRKIFVRRGIVLRGFGGRKPGSHRY